MLFGACDTGLFYADLSDPFPTTIPAVQRVSTCSSTAGYISNPLLVTNDRVYITCGGTLRAYILAVNSNGVVTVSDTDYINISPIGCSSDASTIIPSMVVGRPDAIWTRCDGGLYSNICGFGYALSVAPAGDTYACTACASGAYQSSYGFSSDLSCTACAVGTYLASPSDPNCTFCAAGKYQPSTSATTCLQCPLGKYQPATGTSSCLACDLPYTTTSSVGATNFSQCSQEICEVPGSNALYCVSVFGSATLHRPLSFIVYAGISIIAVALSTRLI